MNKYLKILATKYVKNFLLNLLFENEYGTHIKSKVKENKTRFHNNEVPKKDTSYRCPTLIKIEAFSCKSEELKYYPQVFLEECRYRLDDGGLRIDESDESDNMP